jgi:hypothetical protein
MDRESQWHLHKFCKCQFEQKRKKNHNYGEMKCGVIENHLGKTPERWNEWGMPGNITMNTRRTAHLWETHPCTGVNCAEKKEMRTWSLLLHLYHQEAAREHQDLRAVIPEALGCNTRSWNKRPRKGQNLQEVMKSDKKFIYSWKKEKIKKKWSRLGSP